MLKSILILSLLACVALADEGEVVASTTPGVVESVLAATTTPAVKVEVVSSTPKIEKEAEAKKEEESPKKTQPLVDESATNSTSGNSSQKLLVKGSGVKAQAPQAPAVNSSSFFISNLVLLFCSILLSILF